MGTLEKSILRKIGRGGRRTALGIAEAFTLVELIVVITILAILATVGFLTLSGYTDDARSATVAANVRTVYSAILTESTTSGNSPRYYVDHDPAAALSGGIVFVDGNPVALTGGQWGSGGTNYSAGNPKWDRLRMNGDKFRLSAVLRGGIAGADGFGGIPGPSAFGGLAELVGAAYDTGAVSVGAFDYVGKAGVSGKARTAAYFQVAGVSPGTKKASVTGNYTAVGTGAVAGLVKDPGSTSSTGAIVDSATVDPKQCQAGYYGIAGSCAPCQAGYYCPAGSSSATQNQCPVNSYCPAASASPTACPANTVSTAWSTAVSSCTAASNEACGQPLRISKTTYGGWWPNAEIQAAIRDLPSGTKICMKSSANAWNWWGIEFTRNSSTTNGTDWWQSTWYTVNLGNYSKNTYSCSSSYCFRQVYGTSPWSHNNSFAWLLFGIDATQVWHPWCWTGPVIGANGTPAWGGDCYQNVDFHW